MIVLIVAGGSGTRLWPLSVPEYPKHLLNVTGNKSLLQNAFDRAKAVTSVDKIYISTVVNHSGHVFDQLDEIPKSNIIVEPGRRDTMPCILNAIDVIRRSHGSDMPIASIHADHHISDVEGFAKTIKSAGESSVKYQRITLLGLEPTEAATKYGYIHRGDSLSGESLFEIAGFKEKPELEIAKEYFSSGEYYWNMGYFVAPFSVFEKTVKDYADEYWSDVLESLKTIDDEERDNFYLGLKKEAIDTALMEKAKNLSVIPGRFDWLDVGSFDDVYRISDKDNDGNTLIGGPIHCIDSNNIYVRDDVSSKHIAVIGLDNITVVNTKHGLLIMKTDQSQKVKHAAGLVSDA